MRFLACLALYCLILLPQLRAVPIEITYTDAPGTGFYDPTPRAAVGGNPGTTLGEQRRIAFEFAARRWSDLLTGTIPIKVRASFELNGPEGDPPEAPFLATARAQGYFTNPPQGGPLPLNATQYPTALANQLVNQEIVLNGSTNDIIVECNSYYETNGSSPADMRRWYYGLDSSPPGGGFDFVVVALHEIGHGLGFVSHVTEDGSYLFGSPTIWDRQLTIGDGTPVTSLTQSQRAAARTSNDLFMAGPLVTFYNGNAPAKVFAPATFEQGSSLSHFDEGTFSTAGSLNELMTPVSSFGTQNIGPLALNSLRDFGFVMADTQAPEVAIDSPLPGKSYRSSALFVSGSARDRSPAGTSAAAGLQRVKLALSDSSARWYSWTAGSFFSTTFNHAEHVATVVLNDLSPVSTGWKNWTAALPAGLPDGFYQIHVEAVDQLDQGSGYQVSSFTIDNAAPAAVIEPWANLDTVFDLEGLRVLAPDAVSVGVKILYYDAFAFQLFYWSGTNWSTTDTTLPAAAVNGRWEVTAALPSRANLPVGPSIAIRATATDAASNATTVQLNVSRSAPDNTPPLAEVLSPANGAVLPQPSLPILQGIAADVESGMQSVTLTLSRFLPGGGVAFWSGSQWTETPADLPVNYNTSTGNWTAPAGWALPGGATLPNGGYVVQITATNRESPANTTAATSSFTVDYHPIYTWTGETMRDAIPGNDSNSWDVPQNWSPHGVPGAEDIAIIDNGDHVASSTSRSLHGLKLLAGFLDFTQGAGPAGTVTTSDASEWGAATFHGAWVNDGTLLLSGGVHWLWTSSSLTNNGIVTHQAGVVVGRENGTITNSAAATWISAAAGDLFNNFNGGNQFISHGIFRQTAAADSELNDWSFTLGGEVQKHGAALGLRGDFVLPAGTTLAGAGVVRLLDGTATVYDSLTNSGGTFAIAGGTLAAAAPVVLHGGYAWSGGAWQGDLTLSAGSTLSLDGPTQLNPSATFLNAGTVSWNTPHPLVGRENVSVTNAAGATWEFAAAGAPFANFNGGNSFTNHGLLNRTAPAGDVHLHSWTYHHHGVFHATAGETRIGSTLNLMAGCSFTGAGNFLLLDQTWLKGAATFTAPVTSSGHFHGEAAGQVLGTLRWSAGIMDGTVNVDEDATLRVVSTADRWVWQSSVIDCSGEFIWEEGGILGRENSTIRVRGGGTCRVASAAAMSNFNGNNRLVIDDGAIFEKTSSGTTTIHWALDNDGTAEVGAGLLSLHGGGSSDGDFSGSPGGVIRFADGSHVLEAGATTAGAVEITGGSLLAGGPAGGRIDVKGGTLGSSGGGVFSFAGSSTWTGGVLLGQVSAPAGASLVASGPNQKWVWSSSTLEVAGRLEWQGGHPVIGYENSTIDVKPGGKLRLTADGDLFANFNNGNRLLLAGTIEKTSGPGATLVDEWSVEGAGMIRPETGSIDFTTTVVLGGGTNYEGSGRTRYLGGDLHVRGTSTLAAGAGVDFAGAWIHGHADGTALFQGGSIDWSAGVINGQVTLDSTAATTGTGQKWIWSGSVLRNDGTLTLGGTGGLIGRENSRLVNLPDGTLVCPGTSSLVNFNEGNRLENEGLLRIGAPVGRQTMHWTFQQTARGTLAIEVGGTDAIAPDFDILQVFRAAELGGTLAVATVNGYLPAADTLFAILSGAPVTGSFATVQAPGFSVEYSAGAVTLRAGSTGLNYEDWADDNDLAGADRASDADPDSDGVGNFLEYAFNTDPTQRSPYPVTSAVMTLASQKWVVLKYRTWQDRIDAGLGYHAERSGTLGSWTATGLTDEVDPDAAVIPGSEARRCRIPLAAGKDFLRLRVE